MLYQADGSVQLGRQCTVVNNCIYCMIENSGCCSHRCKFGGVFLGCIMHVHDLPVVLYLCLVYRL